MDAAPEGQNDTATPIAAITAASTSTGTVGKGRLDAGGDAGCLALSGGSTIGVAEASYLMKGMIEFRADLIYVIFAIMATGFVILTLPIGVLFTTLSRRLAVRR